MACERCNVWQHSACLGISQADAEKDDFHFICQDCQRREEDAKKPKIPSLKFRIGASTSPPDQKPKVIIPPPTDIQQRSLDNGEAQRPSLTHLKSSDRLEQQSHVRSTGLSQPFPNGIHFSMMNGVDPATHQSSRMHQSSEPSANGLSKSPHPSKATSSANSTSCPQQRPPNESFQPPPFMTNGHHYLNEHIPPTGHYQPYSNNYISPQPNNRPLPRDQHSPPQPGWSARYIPPPAQSHTQSPNGQLSANQSTFTDASKALNSPSSHRLDSAQGLGNSISTKIGDASLPPPQYRTPSSSFDAKAPSLSASPQVNGFATHNSAAAQPIGPPSQSPIKQPSPSTTLPPHPPTVPSSPFAHKPSFPADEPVRPGFSPVKQDSPQQAFPAVHNGTGNITALPPIAKLAPSPTPNHKLPPFVSSPLPGAIDGFTEPAEHKDAKGNGRP